MTKLIQVVLGFTWCQLYFF